jgi:DNA-binding MarR family transcriptional regulator
VVEAFWEAFPPLWGQIRAHIRRQAVERYGITVEQFYILRHIHKCYRSVHELAGVKGISRAAVSQAVDALVSRGLVTRRPDPVDRRRVQLELILEGHALLEALFQEASLWLQERLAPLPREELESLLFALKILRRISAHAGDF